MPSIQLESVFSKHLNFYFTLANIDTCCYFKESSHQRADKAKISPAKFKKNQNKTRNKKKTKKKQHSLYIFQELCGWLLACISKHRSSDAQMHCEDWPTPVALDLDEWVSAKATDDPCMCQWYKTR